MVPDEGYLAACSAACREKQVLFIADEIQSGLARTGKMLACDHEDVRPDILILGKALSGGVYPVSAVLPTIRSCSVSNRGSMAVRMEAIPSRRVAMEALSVLKEERLAENSERLGALLLSGLKAIDHPMIRLVRGKGLFCAMVIEPTGGKDAWDVCLALKENGLLAKPTHGDIIRFAPPLIINESQLEESVWRSSGKPSGNSDGRLSCHFQIT